MPRSRTTLSLLAAFTLILALSLVIIAARTNRPGSRQATSGYQGSTLPVNIPSPGFKLRDQDGKPVTLESLKGGPSILTFLYTDCRDICPLTAQQIRGAMDRTGQDVPVVAITVDPAGDTPRRVRRWLAAQHLQGRIRWALGSEEELQPVWRAYGVAPQTDRGDHSAYVFILDRTARRCISWPVSQLTPESLAHDLELLARRSGACTD